MPELPTGLTDRVAFLLQSALARAQAMGELALAELELSAGNRPEAATLLARQAALVADPLAAGHLVAREDHDHAHGQDCGHPAVPHGDHVDYVHDGHRHAAHGSHYDEH